MRLDPDFGRDVLIAVVSGIAAKWIFVAFVFGSGGIEQARWVASPGVGVAIGAVVLGVLRAWKHRRKDRGQRETSDG
jgi:membrane associated rhomboid family serine protease